MNYELTKKMQNNWTALGGLTETEKQCLIDCENHTQFLQPTSGSGDSWLSKSYLLSSTARIIHPYQVWRIDPDWKPLEDLPEGFRLVTEEERKKYKKPDSFMYLSEGRAWQKNYNSSKSGWQPGVKYAVAINHVWDEDFSESQKYRLRKPYPVKVGRWVEYDVKPINGKYMVLFNSSNKVGLRKVQDMVGFGGVKFDGQEDQTVWYTVIAACIDDNGSIYVLFEEPDERPAVPVKARLWMVK